MIINPRAKRLQTQGQLYKQNDHLIFSWVKSTIINGTKNPQYGIQKSYFKVLHLQEKNFKKSFDHSIEKRNSGGTLVIRPSD